MEEELNYFVWTHEVKEDYTYNCSNCKYNKGTCGRRPEMAGKKLPVDNKHDICGFGARK